MTNKIRLIEEWASQDAILVSWPHKDSDWNDMLNEIDECYKNIVSAILNYEPVIILTPEPVRIESLLSDLSSSPYKFYIMEMPTNDTWIRDYGPLSFYIKTEQKEIKAIADFTFNGWGMKFAANKDNIVNRCLYLSRFFNSDVSFMNRLILSIEGGGIESDGNGTILTTSSVLYEPNRNAGFQTEELKDIIIESLGANRLFTLNHGVLEGDDTDGHIDTLARFISDNSIAYVYCDDESDIHYHELKKMEEELKSLKNINGHPYELVPLPLPKAIFDKEGDRLPATYANFLFVNGAILLPIYGQDYDSIAIDTLKNALPTIDIVPVNCNALITQHGSLHCATMQIPEGFINWNKFKNK